MMSGSIRMNKRDGGFTLIEIMAALAILGIAVFVLLQAHYTALNLHVDMVDELTMRQLVETTVARAEADVLIGTMSGGDEFGARYPGYSWSYEAVKAGAEEDILLYEVNIVITGPEEERTLSLFTFNIGEESEESGGGSLFDDSVGDGSGSSGGNFDRNSNSQRSNRSNFDR